MWQWQTWRRQELWCETQSHFGCLFGGEKQFLLPSPACSARFPGKRGTARWPTKQGAHWVSHGAGGDGVCCGEQGRGSHSSSAMGSLQDAEREIWRIEPFPHSGSALDSWTKLPRLAPKKRGKWATLGYSRATPGEHRSRSHQKRKRAFLLQRTKRFLPNQRVAFPSVIPRNGPSSENSSKGFLLLILSNIPNMGKKKTNWNHPHSQPRPTPSLPAQGRRPF